MTIVFYTTGNYGSGEIMVTGMDPNWGVDPKKEAERLEKELAAQRRAEEIFTNPESSLEKVKIDNHYVDVYALNDKLDEWDFTNIEDYNLEWLVHYYNHDSYDGSGNAVGKVRKKDEIFVWDLGHCSCFGPLNETESGKKPVLYTKETYRVNVVENVLGPQLETVMSTLVNKLLGL